jgi:hypothetical protein
MFAERIDLRRKPEPDLYSYSVYVAEWWNTWSNALFVVIGVLRYRAACRQRAARKRPRDRYALPTLWAFYAAAGFCSAFHHSQDRPWTILIDWVPIAGSILFVLRSHRPLLRWVSPASYAGLAFAVLFLAVDHAWTVLPPPWGHVLWHVSAAYSIAAAYQDMDLYYRTALPTDAEAAGDNAIADGTVA